ncbi:hypothetical protein HGRIS_007256 [Hohenbuehelia grisea]|uniref:Uncharacterized protein n=1 Tax=Hohenbuehelia grisea TaxID=104357 RepID=A0ABR3JC35_9AGAR
MYTAAGESGGGEGENAWEDIDDIPVGLGENIGMHQQAQVRHDRVSVPEHSCPFPAYTGLFATALAEVEAAADLPEGYGIWPDEWSSGSYPTYEFLRSGKKRKELRISLSDSVWRPRVARWCHALDLMNRLMYRLGSENDI